MTKHYNKLIETLPNVNGKVFAITGTTSGTGNIAARTVAKLGGEAVLLNRKSERSTNSLAAMKEEYPDAKFVSIECDLQSFESVKKAIAEIISQYKNSGIYCVACNAGVMATPDQATVDGYDIQMQTNHLSHFLLIEELLPLLEEGAQVHGEARIVTHSSNARDATPNKGLEAKYFGKNGGNLGGNELKLFSGPCFERYFQTKLANSVHMYGLHERLQTSGSKVKAISCHPGACDTNLGDRMKIGFFTDLFVKVFVLLMTQTPEDGAVGLLVGMMDPKAESGVLYGPKNTMSGPAVPNPPKEYETDPKAIEMLFQTSEEAVAPFRS